jgi:hypothetical protein
MSLRHGVDDQPMGINNMTTILRVATAIPTITWQSSPEFSCVYGTSNFRPGKIMII